jgi:hypothetical protein
MPLLGLVQSDDGDGWRDRARRAGWRVKILWVLSIVIVLIAVL